jgi:hypothetical protein
MSYKTVIWSTFVNSWADSQDRFVKLLEREDPSNPGNFLPIGDGWNSSATAEQVMEKYEETVGFRVVIPTVPGVNTYAVGISELEYDRIDKFEDLRVGFLIQTGGGNAVAPMPVTDPEVTFPLSKVQVFQNHDVDGFKILGTAAPIDNTYDALEMVFDETGTLRIYGLIAGAEPVEYTVEEQWVPTEGEFDKEDFVFPQRLYVFGYDNYTYHVEVDINNDGIEDPLMIGSNPELTDTFPVAHPNGFDIWFNKGIDTATVIPENLFLEKKVTDLQGNVTWEFLSEYEVYPGVTSSIITVRPFSNLDYENEYRITLTSNIVDIHGIALEELTLYFYTSEPDFGAEEIIYNTNTQDIYFKTVNLWKFLDVDTIYSPFANLYNLQYHMTVYNPETGEYEVIDSDSLGDFKPSHLIDNASFMQEMVRHAFLYDFDKYFSTIKQQNELFAELNADLPLAEQYPAITEDEQNKLLLLILRNIRNVNMFKGTENEMEVVLSVFASAVGQYLAGVVEDPYDRFVYRVSTSLERIHWDSSVRKISHPAGWDDLYFYIPAQLNDNLQLEDDLTADELSESAKAQFKGRSTVTYLEVGYFNPTEGYNFWNYHPSFHESGGILQKDIASPDRTHFRHNDYTVSINYDHADLIDSFFVPWLDKEPTRVEIVEMIMSHIGIDEDQAWDYLSALEGANPSFVREIYKLPVYEVDQDRTIKQGHSTFDLKFNIPGVAAEYEWQFWYNGVKKFTKWTGVPKLRFTDGTKNPKSYEVKLVLHHDGWQAKVSSFYPTSYVHQRFNYHHLKAGIRPLDVKGLDQIAQIGSYAYDNLKSHRLLDGIPLSEETKDYDWVADVLPIIQANATFSVDESNPQHVLKIENAEGLANNFLWTITDQASPARPDGGTYTIRTSIPELTLPNDLSWDVEVTLGIGNVIAENGGGDDFELGGGIAFTFGTPFVWNTTVWTTP